MRNTNALYFTLSDKRAVMLDFNASTISILTANAEALDTLLLPPPIFQAMLALVSEVGLTRVQFLPLQMDVVYDTQLLHATIELASGHEFDLDPNEQTILIRSERHMMLPHAFGFRRTMGSVILPLISELYALRRELYQRIVSAQSIGGETS